MLRGEIPAYAPGNPRRGILDRVSGKVSVPGCRVDYRTNPTLRVKRLRFFTVFTRLVGNGL